MESFKRRILKLQKFIKEANQILEDQTHNDRYTKYIAVNVKRYNDSIDIEDLIKEMKLSKAKAQYIKETFTDEKLSSVHWAWLENESEYFTRELVKGCRNNSPAHYEEMKELVKAGKQTSYPYIDRLKTEKAKIARLNQWAKKDAMELKYLNLLDKELSGFFGRMGGWLGIKEAKDLESRISEVEYILDRVLNSDGVIVEKNKRELDGSLQDAEAYADFDYLNALSWMIEEIKTYNKGMNFKEEVKFRIEEELDGQGFIEDAELNQYAIN